MKKVYVVELIKKFNESYEPYEHCQTKDIYEVSISKGEVEYFEEDDTYGDFELDDYISERFFLSNDNDRFVYGKEIDIEEYKELVKAWSIQSDFCIDETFAIENEAIKYAKDLITQLKNGDFNQ